VQTRQTLAGDLCGGSPLATAKASHGCMFGVIVSAQQLDCLRPQRAVAAGEAVVDMKMQDGISFAVGNGDCLLVSVEQRVFQ